jgi:hypothetical protein
MTPLIDKRRKNTNANGKHHIAAITNSLLDRGRTEAQQLLQNFAPDSIFVSTFNTIHVKKPHPFIISSSSIILVKYTYYLFQQNILPEKISHKILTLPAPILK